MRSAIKTNKYNRIQYNVQIVCYSVVPGHNPGRVQTKDTGLCNDGEALVIGLLITGIGLYRRELDVKISNYSYLPKYTPALRSLPKPVYHPPS